MICYKCGCTLSEKNFCTGCGAEVGMYKKILYMSNKCYNDALEKCYVRDLSGAIALLNQSIKFNRNNVDARNLLGLIYYEIGELTEAMAQWVISVNIRENKNIAAGYLEEIQNDQQGMDKMNQTLKKYNQALGLCYSDSRDYAMVQLKSILGGGSKYLRAHQLLALIAISGEDWEIARREVDRCLAIDSGNTLAQRYKKEIENALMSVDDGRSRQKKVKDDDKQIMRYQSGNETIIMPVSKKENHAGSTLINIAIGLLIGIAITYFLVLPAKIYAVNEAANEKVSVVSDEKDKKTSELDAVKSELTKLKTDYNTLQNQLNYGDGEGMVTIADDALMNAASAYITNPNDMETIGAYLEQLEVQDGVEGVVRTDAFNALYNELMGEISLELASFYYERGYEYYKSEDYQQAAADLKRAYGYDSSNGEALLYLANSLRRIGQEDEARDVYTSIIDLYPGTERASKAESYLAELSNQE